MEKGDYTINDTDDQEEPPSPMTPLPNPAKRTKQSTHSLATHFSFHADEIAKINQESTSARTIKDQLWALTRPSGYAENFNLDVLQYWKTQPLDKEMAKVIALGLTAPASQVTVERVFRILPLILTDRNYHLKDDYLEKYAIVKLNQKWLCTENSRLNKIN